MWKPTLHKAKDGLGAKLICLNLSTRPQAKASISVDAYRTGFDVSLPLFHPALPMRDGASGKAGANSFPANDKYFIAFKGKRYLYGIGSETR